jgi:SPP1 family predicted phage head-tail adaptor
MNPGDLRHRVTIQKFVEEADEFNTPKTTPDPWVTFYTVWAAVEPLSGRELLVANNVTPQTRIRVRIRYLKGVTQGMRVKYGERIFNIQSVADIKERHREMELMCIEGDLSERTIQ